MAKAKAAKKPKLDPNRLDWLVDALKADEPAQQVAGAHHYVPDDDRDAYLRAALASHDQGAGAAYLRAILDEATDADVELLASTAATANQGRMALATALERVRDRLTAAQIGAAIPNLAVMLPYHPFVLANAGTDPVLVDRAAFAERQRTNIDKCRSTKEQDRLEGAKALLAVTGADRTHAIAWLAMEDFELPRDLAERITNEVVRDPGLPAAWAAYRLRGADDDDESARLIAGASDARVVDVLVVMLERGYTGMEAIAYVAPRMFADPRAFDALIAALQRGNEVLFNHLMYRVMQPMSVEQAARMAQVLVELLVQDDDEHAKSGSACFYFGHPGGIPVWREALARELKPRQRERVIDAIGETKSREAEDALIDLMFTETQDRRHVIFKYNGLVPQARQHEVLERIVKAKSFDAAWMFIGAQTNWAGHHTFVLDMMKRALEWDGDAKRRAYMLSSAVDAALALHRFDEARTYLAALGSAKKMANPTEDELEDTILADAEEKTRVADLKAKKLDAADAKLVARLAKGERFALTDDELAAMAHDEVGWVIHRDRETHEVWFFNPERTLRRFDGEQISPLPCKAHVAWPDEGYDDSIPELGEFCADWATDARNLQHHAKDAFARYTLRSGRRIVMRFAGYQYSNAFSEPICLLFPDEADAIATFDALVASPLPDMATEDPFYREGKRDGGGRVYQYGNPGTHGYVVGKEMSWAPRNEYTPTLFATHQAAIAAFDAREAEALRAGKFPREIKVDTNLRPLDEMMLVKWLTDRASDSDRDLAWHLAAIPAIEATLAVSALPLDFQLALGKPATSAEIAAYEATVREPLPDAMRELWSHAATGMWKIGDASRAWLSPAQVIAKRAKARTALEASLHKRSRSQWQFDAVDPLIIDDQGVPVVLYDQRHLEVDTWVDRDTFNYSLAYHLGRNFTEGFVDALVKAHPALKKLRYGESAIAPAPKRVKSKPKPKAKKR
ncbi:MAG: hypothetical protein QM831_42800 [Kofleriaceae bacterium]